MSESWNQAAARAAHSLGGFLRCEECGVTRPLGDVERVGQWLRQGWPEHCSYTMRWWTQAQVAAGQYMASEGVAQTATSSAKLTAVVTDVEVN